MSVPVLYSQRVGRTSEPPISYLMQQALINPDLISLAAGLVDQESLPVKEVDRAVHAILADQRRGCAALQYGTTDGDLPLREMLVKHLAGLEGRTPESLGLTADRLIVGTGSQQLLYLVAETLLDPGDIVLMGVPAYFVYMGALESFGTRMIGLATDEGGLIPEEVDRTLARLESEGELHRVKFVYDVGYFNNPTGLSLAAERRSKLLEIVQRWSQRHRILIVEDAAYRELRYQGDDLPSILSQDPTGETVLYAATFSKPFSPGFKTGYIVVPQSMKNPLVYQKGHHDFGSPNFGQQVLAQAMQSGDYASHLATLRRVYQSKLAAMLDELEIQFASVRDRVTWTRPTGGLYVWLTLPAEIPTHRNGDLFQECLRAGVLFVPAEFFYPRSHPEPIPASLRLSFGVLGEQKIREGIRRLAEVVLGKLGVSK